MAVQRGAQTYASDVIMRERSGLAACPSPVRYAVADDVHLRAPSLLLRLLVRVHCSGVTQPRSTHM
jgi:hypothetical protein